MNNKAGGSFNGRGGGVLLPGTVACGRHLRKSGAVMKSAEDPDEPRSDPERALSPEELAVRREWEREQTLLKTKLIIHNTEAWQDGQDFLGLERVGGVDISYSKEDDTIACASLVVLSYPELEVIFEDCHTVTLDAPYVAGFLAFREAPSLAKAVQNLMEKDPSLMPQVLLVDGNGVLHHRGFGVACHLGILTDLPCAGVAKNLLQVDGLENNEEHKSQIRRLKSGGDSFSLTGSTGGVLGTALKSCDKSSKPIYVSVGHKISLEAAVRLVHSCCRYRVPEPIRQADIRSREFLVKIVAETKASPDKE